ncbi:MAG: hypothetical protein IKR57_00830 [Bacilli bacterium]|nr:hypothetical protein [Bacilli bacterium]
MNNYEEIIDIKHFDPKHPRMSIYNRSAQFAAFDALEGYSDSIIETSRLTTKRIELEEEAKSIINDKLNIIEKNIKNNPECMFTYFVYDTKKSGGKYKEIIGKVKKIDLYSKEVKLINDIKIPIREIIDITILDEDKMI